MKKAILWAAALVVLTAACTEANSPESAVDGFYKHSSKGDFATAMEYTVADSATKAQLVEEFTDGNIQVLDYKILSCELEPGDTLAMLQVRVKVTTTGRTEPVESLIPVRAEQANGIWKMSI